ncbi:sensor histidine kinase [Actinophytocola sp.]|uniref:sensor histidine kinase n=1 Tax=Actinophytocola sp. TaxID=1872138 RepID=UPI00389ABA35
MPRHLTARGRLTILYTALVLAAGLVLTALTYLLMRQNLGRRLSVVILDPRADADEPLPPPQAFTKELKDVTLSEFLAQAAVALVVVTLLAAVLGWVVAGRILRPIRTISATAQRLSAENLSERVPVTVPADELATLADTINGMLDRIQHGVAERDRVLHSQRMFTANAAHELRTPLTTMRTAIDVTLDGHPTHPELVAMTLDIRTAVAHSQRTLDGLLALARTQAGVSRHDQVDVADVVRHLLDATAADVAAGDLTLHTELRPASVQGEPVLLERMVSNLIDNAVRYNHAGGHLAVTTGATNGRAFIRIANTGPPIPPHTTNRLLEPFVRGEGARLHTDTGAGLGLSIVHAIVIAHGGEIAATAREKGGLDITVHLPVQAISSP